MRQGSRAALQGRGLLVDGRLRTPSLICQVKTLNVPKVPFCSENSVIHPVTQRKLIFHQHLSCPATGLPVLTSIKSSEVGTASHVDWDALGWASEHPPVAGENKKSREVSVSWRPDTGATVTLVPTAKGRHVKTD